MSDAIVFEVDPGNRISTWPEAARELFGHDARTALGRSWVELLGARDIAGNRLCERGCALHAMGRAGETIGVFEIHVTLDGGITMRLLGRAEPRGNGGYLGLRVILWRERRRGSLERRRGDEAPLATLDIVSASPLSARETEVLRLLSRGQGVDEIAGRLGISAATVRNHAQRLLPKLGASNRAEAVSIAIRRGLL